MGELRVFAVPQEDGRLILEDASFHKGEPVEVVVSTPQNSTRTMTAKDLLESGLVGIWADREDIGDSVEYARELRRQITMRRHEP